MRFLYILKLNVCIALCINPPMYYRETGETVLQFIYMVYKICIQTTIFTVLGSYPVTKKQKNKAAY